MTRQEAPISSGAHVRRRGVSEPGAGGDIAAVVAAAAAGDSQAMEALIERYSALVWSIAWTYRLSGSDAADVSQVVWLRLVEKVSSIRQPASIGAWLASVTRHECLRLLRRAEREVATADDGELDDWTTLDEVDGPILLGERKAALHQAFDSLPARWRSLVQTLMEAPTASYEEVASAVGMPIGSIGPTRQRCLARLRLVPALADLVAA